jgi:hypothetical protein
MNNLIFYLDIISNIQNFMLMIQILKRKYLIVSLIFDKILFIEIWFSFFFLGIQRGHQNTLEAYPEFLVMLGLGSIKYPVISSIGGIIWLIGRIVFFQVYIKYLVVFLVWILLFCF